MRPIMVHLQLTKVNTMQTESTANLQLVAMVNDRSEVARKLGSKRAVHPAAQRALDASRMRDTLRVLGVVICAVLVGVMLAWRG